jgi:cyclohexyl-isocyanide hydratase
MQVNIILVPEMVQLDITGPYEVLARVSNWNIDLVAESLNPVKTDRGLVILPTQTRQSAKPSDLLVVPGGAGIDIAMLDTSWVDYVRKEATSARHVFGICTGAFLLAAAGVLKGRLAGAHWQARDLLSQVGVIPSDERIVIDGKFYTSGGVTSGIDAALKVVADIEGINTAQKIQLAMEYDPDPPFEGGTPLTSPKHIVDQVLETSKSFRVKREKQVAELAARLTK